MRKNKKSKAMFLGEYHHSMDEKGRVAIPIKFRGLLKTGGVVTRGLDSCLFIYPIEEWQVLAERLANLPIARANSRAFARLMLAGAMEISVDKQGRIMIPDYLRDYADVKKKVVLAGLYNRCELWDEIAWRQYRTGTEANSSAIAEAMNELGV